MHAPKDRSHGKFGVLIDTYGTAYPAYQYKILEGSPTPPEPVEGYMTYALP